MRADNEFVPNQRRTQMLVNDLGESKVTIRKDELLHVVEQNLEKHVEEYKKATAGYRDEITARLKAALEEIQTEGTVDLNRLTELPRPQSHEKDYERVIRMLRMSVATEITISETQFQMYVMDDWSWKQVFAAVSRRYSK